MNVNEYQQRCLEEEDEVQSLSNGLLSVFEKKNKVVDQQQRRKRERENTHGTIDNTFVDRRLKHFGWRRRVNKKKKNERNAQIKKKNGWKWNVPISFMRMAAATEREPLST